MVILEPALEESAVQQMINRSTEVLTKGEGKVNRVEKWGKRRLAYELNHRQEGYYVLFDVLADPAPMDELDRYRPAIEAVGDADVQSVAMRHIRPDELAIVLVGDADAILPALEGAAIGPITVAIGYNSRFVPVGASLSFDASTLTSLFAIFTYNNMTNGAQVSTIWFKDSEPIYIDTASWEGGTGGYGASSCPLEICLYEAGNYRVAIYVGEALKQAALLARR